jgi:adenine deaminase
MGGGMAVSCNGKTLASLPLPVAGLMAETPVREVNRRLLRLNGAARRMGCRIPDPFMTLSFLALPVIPELKLTDRGLVDVTRFRIVPVFGKE